MIDDIQHPLQIIPIPAFNDNYLWLIHNQRKAIVVDPGDAVPVINTLKKLNLELQTILITHHHQDHIGGVDLLLRTYPNLEVFAPKLEQYSFAHKAVSEPEQLYLGDWISSAKVIDVPGHTLGHVAYYIEHQIKQQAQQWLFCGDTLFGAGCGRLFEGTPAQMMASLQKLTALPANTQVYCTHEYTLHNINFALTLEPGNPSLVKRQHDAKALLAAGQPTLPSTLALELATNPFLRSHMPEIQATMHMETADSLQTFSAIRALRNSY
nr:hydroxyacylglutathione hydrolase [uncultured Methylotenera sp.]